MCLKHVIIQEHLQMMIESSCEKIFSQEGQLEKCVSFAKFFAPLRVQTSSTPDADDTTAGPHTIFFLSCLDLYSLYVLNCN